jgi:putative FmdB family regulatory protein
MPIYEYRCTTCGRRAQIFFRSFSAVTTPTCPHCQSTELERIPSRVSTVRSESSQMDYFSDPTNFSDVDYTDPRAMAEWAKRMGDAAGVDMGDDYEEMVEQLASGDEGGDLGGAGFGDDDFGGSGDFGDL